MITIPVKPFWEKLQQHYTDHVATVNPTNPDDTDYPGIWNWLRDEYGTFQVYIVPDPKRHPIEDSSGLLFGEASEATFFTLKWS